MNRDDEAAQIVAQSRFGAEQPDEFGSSSAGVLGVAGDHGTDEFFPAPEVIVDGRVVRVARVLGDAPVRDTVDAVGREQLLRGVE